MSMDEVRDLENMPRLNFGFYKFNIADAMYYRDDDNDTNMLVNVNTNTAIDLNQVLNTKSESGVMDFNPNHSKSVLNDKNFGQADKVAIGQEDTQDEENKKEVSDLKDKKNLGGE